MILPERRAIIRGATARATRNALVRFVSSTSRHCASVISASGARRWMPALLIRMSIGAYSASSFATAAITAAPSVTSKAAVVTRTSSASSADAARSSLASSRPFKMIDAPAWASPRAIAKPRPWLEPVTSAVRPVRSKREEAMVDNRKARKAGKSQPIFLSGLPMSPVESLVPRGRRSCLPCLHAINCYLNLSRIA